MSSTTAILIVTLHSRTNARKPVGYATRAMMMRRKPLTLIAAIITATAMANGGTGTASTENTPRGARRLVDYAKKVSSVKLN